MTIKRIVLLCCVFAFFSCSKEKSFEAPDFIPPVKTGLLLKSEAITGSDTLVTLYTYDTQNRLETLTSDGKSGGVYYYNYKRYVRDAATGRIDLTLQLIKEGTTTYDTIRMNVHYPDATTQAFDYTLSNASFGGIAVIDSSVYTYSTNGKMESFQTHISAPDYGIPPTLLQQSDFTYNSDNNVADTKVYAVSAVGGSLDYVTKYEYTYSGEPDYLWMTDNSAQNFLLVGIPNTKSKNMSLVKIEDQTGNGQDLSIATVIAVGADNKPVSGVVTVTPSNVITKYTFYYQ